MKAVKFKSFGGPDVLEVVETRTPLLKQNEILIEVHSAGVNPIDTKIREGSSFVAKSLNLPAGMGYDVCGEVDICGGDTRIFKPGDIVLGTVGRHDNPCSYSEFCVGKESDFVILPKGLDSKTAGGIPIAALTAWQGLYDYAHIKEGEKVLIHAGAGGVGHFAVQFAKLAKAHVTVTASERHHKFLKELGADQIIDYTKENFFDKAKGLDLVFDLVGGDVGCFSISCLKKGGRMVTVPTITRDKVLKKSVELGFNAMGMLAETKKEDLEKITTLLVNNEISYKVAATFPLEKAADAHKLIEEKHTQGKIVIQV